MNLASPTEVNMRWMSFRTQYNHPSTQTLSVEDISFFLHFGTVKYIVVVTNQGTVHYLYKDEQYEYGKAKQLLDECVSQLNNKSSLKDYYYAGLSFLARCSEVGLYYR